MQVFFRNESSYRFVAENYNKQYGKTEEAIICDSVCVHTDDVPASGDVRITRRNTKKFKLYQHPGEGKPHVGSPGDVNKDAQTTFKFWTK